MRPRTWLGGAARAPGSVRGRGHLGALRAHAGAGERVALPAGEALQGRQAGLARGVLAPPGAVPQLVLDSPGPVAGDVAREDVELDFRLQRPALARMGD